MPSMFLWQDLEDTSVIHEEPDHDENSEDDIDAERDHVV